MSVRDLGLLEFPDGEPAHGAGWFVLIRPLYALTGLSPMTLNVALSALSVVCFGAAVSRALDRRAGFAAAVLLAALPVQVRTAPTVSMFVVSQLGLTATWLLVEAHLRDRSAWSRVSALAALLRVERRAFARARWRSVLFVALVATPCAALVAAVCRAGREVR
jgi:hypothetical protein